MLIFLLLLKSSSISDFNKDLCPISLTSTLSKVAESIVIDQELEPALLQIIDVNRYGFIPGSSTTIALISILHNWLYSTDKPDSAVRAIFLDFRKAFDLIDHTLLIAKLFSVGIKPSVVNWIADFLKDRYQRVKVNNLCFSDWMKIPAGVPQGTRLGPFLFLPMINDLSIPNIMLSLWKFADDSTILDTIPSSDLHSTSLQENIDHIVHWLHLNKFQLIPEKCKELTICFKKQKPVFDPIIIAG